MKVIETTDFFFVARNISAVTKDLSDDKSLMVCPCGSMSKEDAFHVHCPSRKVRDEFYNKLFIRDFAIMAMSKKIVSLKPKAKPDCVIGIDPDAVKSGIAFLEIGTRKLECATLRFCDLMEYLQWAKGVAESKSQSFIVVIEGGWLNAGNWHLPKVCSKQKAAAQGRSVGMNHQTGLLIAEFCEHHGIPFEIVKPLQKIWRGHDRKITHEELVAICDPDHVLTRTNQEQRDAALLAWWYAGLPIRITKTKKLKEE